MIAKKFSPEFSSSGTILIFASGVSDSKKADTGTYLREEKLLIETILQFPAMRVVYFSTCSIYDPSQEKSFYILHKLNMERLIKMHASSYLICRTTNIVGENGNMNTIINYLIEKIATGSPFERWNNAVRNILDVDDLYAIIKALLEKFSSQENRTVNIFNPIFYSVKHIIQTIEKHLFKMANYIGVEKGCSYSIPDICGIHALYAEMSLCFPGDYLSKVLNKYYPVSFEEAFPGKFIQVETL